MLFSSCSSEDSSNGLDGVPSGEIVSVEKRQLTLTGFSDSHKIVKPKNGGPMLFLKLISMGQKNVERMLLKMSSVMLRFMMMEVSILRVQDRVQHRDLVLGNGQIAIKILLLHKM